MLVSALNDYDKLICFNLEELWFVSGKSDSSTIFIFHDLLAKWSIVYYTFTFGLRHNSKVATKNKKLLHKEKNIHVACYITFEKMKLMKM